MVLGFTQKFPSGKPTNFRTKILSGEKIHTIRTDANNRWEPGKNIQFATGVRTKNYNQFALGRCTRVSDIVIDPYKKEIEYQTFEGGAFKSKLTLKDESDLHKFARNDGFDSLEDFWKWFNKPFEGKLIFWELFENGRGE